MANNTNLSFPSAFCQQFLDRNGKPLAGGKLYSYIAGSPTPVVTYKTISGGTESANRNTNPIILDMNGMAELVIAKDTAYKFVLFDRNNVKINEWDNVTAGGSEGGGSSEDIVVVGTTNEINVSESVTQGVKRYVVSLSNSVKSVILYLVGLYENVVNSLDNKADKVQGATAGNLAALDANGNITDSDYKVSDFTSAITAATDLCEKLANKKTTFSGFETSDTYYPTLKAVVDYLDGRLQNLGGKKITNNGVPFTTASQLPTTTPYYGQNINSDDYAYVQSTGLASRYTAIVNGSSVAWVLDYEIALPVFTAEQQAAIDSGVTAEMLGTFLIKTGDGSNVTATFTAAGSRTNISTGEKLSVMFGKIAKWLEWLADLKAVAFSGSYSDLSDKPTIPSPANNGVLTIKQNGTSKGTFSANQSSNTEINVTDTTYESKSAASGGTAVSLVTTGEKYTWNAKQNALPTSGTPSSTFAINVSGNAATATSADAIRKYSLGVSDSKPWRKVLSVTGLGKWSSAAVVLRVFNRGYAVTNNLATYYGTVVFRIYRGNDTDTYPTYRDLFVDNGMYADPSAMGWNACIVWTSANDAELWLHCNSNSSSVSYEVEYSYNCTVGDPIGSALSALEMTTYLNDKSYKNPIYSVADNGTYPSMTVGNSTNASYSAKIGRATDHPQIGAPDTPVYIDESGEPRPCSLPSSVQTWVGEVSSTATCEYYGGVYRFRGNLALNHGWGDGAHGYINYQMVVTMSARKGKNCPCGFRLTPHYSGGTGISFKQIYSQFVDSPSVFIAESQLHESGIGPCGTGSGRTIPTSLDYDIVVESSDWSVGESVNISLYVTAVKQ